MQSEILEAVNCNRTYIAKNVRLNASFNSKIADFKDMPMGSVQIIWRGVTGVFNGEIKLFASILPEDDSLFDGGEIDGAVLPISSANGNQLWVRERLGFRFLQARFTPNSISDGFIDIVALGKKS